MKNSIEDAAKGLVYSSESDRPFRFFSLQNSSGWPFGPEEFGRRFPEPLDRPFEERTLEQFFKRHIEATDPYDTQAQAVRPMYENLRSVLRENLRDIRVFRFGKIEVKCFVAGVDREGNLAGLRTESVET